MDPRDIEVKRGDRREEGEEMVEASRSAFFVNLTFLDLEEVQPRTDVRDTFEPGPYEPDSGQDQGAEVGAPFHDPPEVPRAQLDNALGAIAFVTHVADQAQRSDVVPIFDIFCLVISAKHVHEGVDVVPFVRPDLDRQVAKRIGKGCLSPRGTHKQARPKGSGIEEAEYPCQDLRFGK